MNDFQIKSILKALPLPYYVIDSDTLKVVGSNMHDYESKDMACHKFICGYDKPCDHSDNGKKCICKEVLKQKQKVEINQSIGQRGSQKINKIIGNPVFDENNKLTHIIVQYVDNTLEYKLQNKVEEQNKELQAQNEEYETINDELKENEKKLRNILENSTNVFYQHSVDHEITYISPQIKNILGYSVEEAKIKWTEFVSDHPVNKKAINITNKAIETGEIQSPYEVEMIHKNGEKVWVEVREAPLIEHGKTVAVVGALSDITVRKAAEEAHQKSEGLYHRLFHSSTIGVVISTFDGRVITANETVCNALGYTLEEFYEVKLREVYDNQADRDKILQILKQDGSVSNFQAQLLTKDGKKKWGLFSIQLFEIDGEQHLVSVIVDINKQKEIEIVLKESNKRFKAYIESSPTAIFIINEEGQYEYANKAVARLLGYTLKDIYNMSIADVKVVKESGKLYDNFNELKKEGVIVGKETKYKTKSGEIIDLILDAVKISENQYIAYCTDISDIKKYQEDLKNKNEQYYALNEELEENFESIQLINEELNKAKDKAEESDRLKSAFLANMSHEIRTPLNGILGFSALLQKESIAKENLTRYVSIIEKSGKRLLSVVNDIFDISLIHANQVKIEEKLFGINSLLDEVFTFYQTVKKEEIEKLDFELFKASDKEIEIYNDQYRLHQIFKNLIENAFKFTKHGKIEFGYQPIEENEVLFYVQDSGIGIPVEYRETIFNSFRQVDDSITRDYEGAGLGLSICSGLIERMGGRIWLGSERKEGSTFFFTLPISDPNKDKARIINQNILDNRMILIVEPDAKSYKYLKKLLQEHGKGGIIQTSNSKDAINILESNNVDMVFMDVKLVGLDGYKLTKQIREINKSTKIIAQVEYSTQKDLQNTNSAKFDDFISKPIREEKLIAIIDKYFK